MRRLYIEDGADIGKEFYVSLVTDRATQRLPSSRRAKAAWTSRRWPSTPKIVTEVIDPLAGLTADQARRSLPPSAWKATRLIKPWTSSAKLYTCYMETDASLVEINPLNRDSKGNLMALDAKFNFDANALFRHPEIVAYRDLDEEDPAEIEPPVRPRPHQPRRQHRLPGQRRRPRDGHHGHHQAVRRRAGQLPRRRRWRDGREGDRSLQDHAQEQERQGHPRQHLRRHHEVRHHRRGRDHRLQGREPLRAAGRAHEGHQRRAGQEDAGRIRPAHHRADTMAEAATKIVAAVA